MKKSLNVYCDTNVYIDIMKDDRASSEASSRAFRLMKSRGIKPFLSTQSMIDAAFIMGRTYKYSIERFRNAVGITKTNFNIVSITEEDLLVASESPVRDFEDAAQIACAQRHGCNVIISSDKRFKNYTGITVYTPGEFVSRMTGAN